MLLYVDDILIAGKSKSTIAETKAMLKSEFEMKDLSAAKRLLGMDIRRDKSKGKLWLSQSQYIEKVLHRFHMSQAKPISTPLATHFKLSTSSGSLDVEEESYMSRVPYACTVGSLMYAMVCTRPDIAHAVSVVSCFMSKLDKEHWKAVQWILMYLRARKYGLMFDQRAISPGQVIGYYDSPRQGIGYSDSDFAGDLDERRSLLAMCLSFVGLVLARGQACSI
jgi:ATP-binding cassette subfamily B (MDR/TAP) protein 1